MATRTNAGAARVGMLLRWYMVRRHTVHGARVVQSIHKYLHSKVHRTFERYLSKEYKLKKTIIGGNGNFPRPTYPVVRLMLFELVFGGRALLLVLKFK